MAVLKAPLVALVEGGEVAVLQHRLTALEAKLERTRRGLDYIRRVLTPKTRRYSEARQMQITAALAEVRSLYDELPEPAEVRAQKARDVMVSEPRMTTPVKEA